VDIVGIPAAFHSDALVAFAFSAVLAALVGRRVSKAVSAAVRCGRTDWRFYFGTVVRPTVWDFALAGLFSAAILTSDPQGPGLSVPPMRYLIPAVAVWLIIAAVVFIPLLVLRLLVAYVVRSVVLHRATII